MLQATLRHSHLSIIWPLFVFRPQYVACKSAGAILTVGVKPRIGRAHLGGSIFSKRAVQMRLELWGGPQMWSMGQQ